MSVIKCEICGRNDFKSAYGLTKHKQQVHANRQSQPNEEASIAVSPTEDTTGKFKAVSKSSTAMSKSGVERSAEEIIDSLPWPTSVNGEVDPVFVAGMRYEAMNVIRGIRLAQQLNKMGLEQAKPVIEMAKEMRQAEGQAAETIAAQLGQFTMQSNQQVINAIHELAASQSQGQPTTEMNPMAKMIFNAIQPYIGNILAQALSSLTKQQVGTQPPSVQQPLVMQGQPNQQSNTDDNAPPSCMKPGEENEFMEV